MPRTPLLVTILLLFALPLAGCLSDDGGATDIAAADTPTPTPDEDAAAPDVDAPEDAEGEAAAPEPAPHVEVAIVNGTITGASPTVSGPVGFCCSWMMVDGENTEGTFSTEGADGVVVELTWSDATFDLDLGVFAPDFEDVLPPELNETQPEFTRGHYYMAYDGMTGSPDGHATIVVTDEEALALAGEWRWLVGTKAGHDVAFTVHVSLFHGGVPADGYTAAAP